MRQSCGGCLHGITCGGSAAFSGELLALCLQGQKTGRRDDMLKWQAAAQRRWADAKVFDEDAPAEGEAVCMTAGPCQTLSSREASLLQVCRWLMLGEAVQDIYRHHHHRVQWRHLWRRPCWRVIFCWRCACGCWSPSWPCRRGRPGREILRDVPVPLHERASAPGPRLLAVQGGDGLQTCQTADP